MGCTDLRQRGTGDGQAAVAERGVQLARGAEQDPVFQRLERRAVAGVVGGPSLGRVQPGLIVLPRVVAVVPAIVLAKESHRDLRKGLEEFATTVPNRDAV